MLSVSPFPGVTRAAIAAEADERRNEPEAVVYWLLADHHDRATQHNGNLTDTQNLHPCRESLSECSVSRTLLQITEPSSETHLPPRHRGEKKKEKNHFVAPQSTIFTTRLIATAALIQNYPVKPTLDSEREHEIILK